jgi:hypothetical protein
MGNNYAIQTNEKDNWIDVEFYHYRSYAIDQFRWFEGKNKDKHSRLIYLYNGNVISEHIPSKTKRYQKDDLEPVVRYVEQAQIVDTPKKIHKKQPTQCIKHNPKIKSQVFCSYVDEGFCYIYAIRCRRNSCFYIGKTGNLTNRVHYHLGKLSRGKHFNKYLQDDWVRYGGHNFYMEVLEVYDTKVEVSLAETRLIEEYSKKCGNRLYNIAGNSRKFA